MIPERISSLSYNYRTKKWEGTRKLPPIPEEKSLEEKINEYLDQKGIVSPEVRAGLIQLIKEYDQE